MFEQLADLYLEYINNYLTIDGMSECLGIEKQKLSRMLGVGSDCHERRVKRARLCPDQQLLDELYK